MGDWLSIQRPGEAARREKIRGVEYTVFVSPHDVPDAVRGSFDQHIDRFVIELRYIGGDEPWDRREEDEATAVRIGRKTGRLYGIEIDTRKLGVSLVGVKVSPEHAFVAAQKAIALGEAASHAASALDSYRFAKQAVAQRKQDLFKALAH